MYAYIRGRGVRPSTRARLSDVPLVFFRVFSFYYDNYYRGECTPPKSRGHIIVLLSTARIRNPDDLSRFAGDNNSFGRGIRGSHRKYKRKIKKKKIVEK